METKPFWASKTFWVNALAAVALAVQSQFGFVLSGEEQGAALILINLVLRAFTTSAVSLR